MKFWYRQQPSFTSCFLRPLSWMYQVAMMIRRQCYQHGWLKTHQLTKPVVVIGNISVGGTGKTPIVIELVEQLKRMGVKPGIVARGYGGHAPTYPFIVYQDSNPKHSGDEPLLIAQKTGAPVVVDPDRPRAARHLIDQYDIDIILSDDGMQHYALARDMEVIVRDPFIGEGNGLCLPAGPLREPTTRLSDVDLIIDGSNIVLDSIYSLSNPSHLIDLKHFNMPVHAIAGIGHPNKFFQLLRDHGLDILEHPFPDHHHFTDSDVLFEDDYPVLMTEKDAVKCLPFVTEQHYAVAIKSSVPDELLIKLQDLLNSTTVNGV